MPIPVGPTILDAYAKEIMGNIIAHICLIAFKVAFIFRERILLSFMRLSYPIHFHQLQLFCYCSLFPIRPYRDLLSYIDSR